MTIIEKIRSGNVDEAEIFEYVSSNDFQIALAATQSPLANAITLKVAALDSDKHIRLAALKNSNISDETVKMLCNDPDSDVAYAAQEISERRHL